MPQTLEGFRVAALVSDRFEQVELTGPRDALREAGATVSIVSPQKQMKGMKHHDVGDTFQADVDLASASPDDFDALLLPGGVINGDSLRVNPEAQRLVKALVNDSKPVAVICHGGWLLISSGVAQGRTVTSWPTLQDDFRNAGAHWVDETVVVDGNWVSSRKPDDIPNFNREMIRVFAEEKKRQRERKAA